MARATHKNRKKKSSNELNPKNYIVVPVNLDKTEFSLFVSEDDDVSMSQEEEIDLVGYLESAQDTKPKYCGKTNRSMDRSSEPTLTSFRPGKPKIYKRDSMVGPMRLSTRLSQRITRCGRSPLKSPILARTLRFSDLKGKTAPKAIRSKRRKSC